MRNTYTATRVTNEHGVVTHIAVEESNGKLTNCTRRIYKHAEASELCLQLARALGLKVVLPEEP